MSFLKRLYFFLFGLGLGIIILVFVTNKKGTKFNYMPNKRVVNDIYKKKWIFKDSNQIILKNDFLKTMKWSENLNDPDNLYFLCHECIVKY